ncbi:MAG: response regulator, partial [Patulibacter sp.]|nr:response regulator [Patulibacter sp.]
MALSPPVVLLVEDESSIAIPFAGALRREGFDPVIAATAADARTAWRSRRPAIVLLDLTLPDGDGRQLCGELRSAGIECAHRPATSAGMGTAFMGPREVLVKEEDRGGDVQHGPGAAGERGDVAQAARRVRALELSEIADVQECGPAMKPTPAGVISPWISAS